MYVNYRDLNKACPKDDFPLPHIDTLIDSAASSTMYYFMHMFDINSMQTKSFNLGTTDNPKNILLASNLTHDEREKMKK